VSSTARASAASARLAAVLVVAIGAPACAGDERTPKEQLTAALEELQARFDSGDLDQVCAGMTPAARERATGSPGTAGCPRAVARLLSPGRRVTSSARAARRRVLAVELRGERATATVTLNDRIPGALELARRDGRWKLDDLAVHPIPAKSTWDEATGTSSEGFSVYRVAAGRRAPCPQITRISQAGGGAVDGGCALTVTSPSAPFILLSAFGDFEIARCRGRYLLYVDNSSNVFAHEVEFSGKPPCRRIAHCKDKETGLRYPWQGQRVPSGAGVVALLNDICVNTPAGRVRGLQVTELRRRQGDWTARPPDYPVGAGSIQIGGRWDVEPDGLEFGPPRRRP
jgi:hypothetical protein